MADTVALMRKRVLDMAIRGELVNQSLKEGTAEKLYQEIQAKKAQLIKDKTLKNEKILTDKKLNELPFVIPSSWKWTRFGEVIHLISGRDLETKSFNEAEKGLPYITGASNFNNGSLIINRWTEYPKVVSIKGDLLITVKGTVGDIHIQEIDKAHIARQVMAIRNVYNLQLSYIKYFLDAQIFELKAKAKSMIPGISREDILLFEFPLPPLQEQKRIVAKIEEIFAVIDQIGTKKEEALSIIRNMRQTALQDAIMGVLVDQDENDEPASVLYEKIQAEKERMIQAGEIKRGKPLPEIEENEIPYEVPKNWGWTRLGDLGFYKKGPFGSALTKSIFVEDSLESIKVYEQKNAIQSDWTLGEYFITKKYYEEKMTSNTVIPGDIIISCAGTIGKSYIIPDNARLGIINQALMRVRVYTINKQYFRLIFNHVIQTDGAQGKGSAIKNIPPMKVLNNLLVPFPPLAEQDRIIEKIDTIMAICDQMEAILNGTTEANEALKISE